MTEFLTHVPEKFLVASIVVKMAPCRRSRNRKLMLPLQICDLTDQQSLITNLLLALLSVKRFLFVWLWFWGSWEK